MTAAPVLAVVRRRWVVLAMLCASLLLVSVDATVLHMALPALSADLRPTATAQLWIISVYSLVAAPLLLAFGTLGDRYGRRRILVLGYLVFGLASLGCALAPNVPVMIAMRALLGVGGAMIMPATLSLLRQAFPDRAERRLAIGIWSGVAGSGAVLGPLLGGFLVQTFSWHAAFLINVPVMVAAVPLTFWLIPESSDPPDGPWDLRSAVLAALGVVGIAFLIKQTQHGGAMYVLGPAAGLAGGLLLAAFVRRQRRLRVPLLPVQLFGNPAFSVAVGSVFVVLAALVGLGLLFAQYLQLVLALEPMDAALRLLFVMVAAIVGSLVAGPLLQRFGNRLMIIMGFAVSAIALAFAAMGIAVTENLWLLGPVLAVTGFGVSVSLTAASDSLLAIAPAEHAGAAAAVEETAYELGAGLGVAILGSLATGVYAASLDVPGTARDGLTEATTVASALPPQAGAALLEAARLAFVDGLRVALVAGTVLFVLAAVAAARALPKSKETRQI
ncbi:DHA2 family multidrug resistance protein-like MFS transporter [Kibdelosporangium banguiense]|uniref:DHA2 family multidrug resistance protein-like MFS transporter n=1 Tax=Kibdelosporangium banguiense TaxID=1365924 RepID=A0ABS4TQ28_9PSEU|nr:MFS transporter [Kibdelosporangium banguiense]MBP2326509.1 DHA2 family multidrug resistance protein-like MFS transporter [Kibdelosporangium banguiense]